MTDRRRLPSAPGIRGVQLPAPDSVPPDERMLRDLAAVEGRLLARLGDIDERLHRVEERQGTGDEDTRAMREGLAQIRTDLGTLLAGLMHAQRADAEHARDIGAVRVELVKAGQLAGAKRGAIAGVGAAIATVLAKWAASKFGIELP